MNLFIFLKTALIHLKLVNAIIVVECPTLVARPCVVAWAIDIIGVLNANAVVATKIFIYIIHFYYYFS
jgi:hypothetical protein